MNKCSTCVFFDSRGKLVPGYGKCSNPDVGGYYVNEPNDQKELSRKHNDKLIELDPNIECVSCSTVLVGANFGCIHHEGLTNAEKH